MKAKIRWAAVAAALALSFSAAAVPADSATADDEVSAQSVAQTFGVRNLTSAMMTFDSATAVAPEAPPRFDNILPPAPGTTFLPAQENLFSMTYWFMFDNRAYLTYKIDGVGTATLKARIDPFGVTTLSCFSVTPLIHCEVYGHSATLRAKDARTLPIPQTSKQAQADALKTLCETPNSHVTCSFRVEGELTKGTSGPTYLGDTHHVNCRSTSEDSVDKRVQKEFGGSQSIGITGQVNLNIGNIVNIGLSVSRTETVTWNRAFVESHTLRVSPRHHGWFEIYAPEVRFTGDFSATVGNDTVLIEDVTFTSPIADDPTLKILVVSREEPLTAEQFERYCTSPPPPLP